MKKFETLSREELINIVENKTYTNILIDNYGSFRNIELDIYTDGEVRISFEYFVPEKMFGDLKCASHWSDNFIVYKPNSTKEECIKLGAKYGMNVCPIEEFYKDF